MSDTELRELDRAVRTNTRATTALIALIVLSVAAAGAYGYWRARQALRPQNVAAEAEEYVKSHYPEWRAELKKEMVRSAPKAADRLSRRAVKSIPDARARLERRLETAVARGLERAQELSTDELREFVRRHKGDIRQAYTQAKQTPEEAGAAVERMEAAVAQELGTGVRSQAQEALAWLRAFNDRLRAIARPDHPATEAEEAERRIARLLKALVVSNPAAGK